MSLYIDWTKIPYDSKLDKADAVLRYLENYDYENLKTLMFPKEDAPFLMEVLEQYINDRIQILPTNEMLNITKELIHSDDTVKNTEITYIYREPETNNKTWISHVLKGECTKEQCQEIVDSMLDTEDWFFYPSLVGLPNYGHESDDIFEWLCMETVDEAPSLDMTIEELVANFKKTYENHWEIDKNHEEHDI